MAHERISAICLRPQTHAVCVWLGAVAAFGPVWVHHDSLLDEAAVEERRISDNGAAEDITLFMNESSDGFSVALEATTLAGKELLLEQKLSGECCKHHLRHDLCLFVPPLQEANKTMMPWPRSYFPRQRKCMIPSLSSGWL